jgi:hypothetical protein
VLLNDDDIPITRVNPSHRREAEHFSFAEVCAMFGISPRTLTRARRAGIVFPEKVPVDNMRGVKWTYRHRYTRDDVRKVMAWAMTNMRLNQRNFGGVLRGVEAEGGEVAAPPSRKCICGKAALYYDPKSGRRACARHKSLMKGR